jgi:hypothetical protein
MGHTRNILIATLAFLLAAAPAPALAQGLYWETETIGAGEGRQIGHVKAMPKMMRIGQGNGQSIVLRSDGDKMIGIDEERKVYWEATLAQLEAASKSMREELEAAVKQMEKQMNDLPPAQRAQVEKVIEGLAESKSDKSPEITVKATGRTRTIGGYECTEYIASEDGKPVLTAWSTESVSGFDAIRDDWMGFQKRMVETSKAFGSPVTEAYTKIPGFPMETDMEGVKTVVTKVEARDIPAADFAPPAGYTKETPEFLE